MEPGKVTGHFDEEAQVWVSSNTPSGDTASSGTSYTIATNYPTAQSYITYYTTDPDSFTDSQSDEEFHNDSTMDWGTD